MGSSVHKQDSDVNSDMDKHKPLVGTDIGGDHGHNHSKPELHEIQSECTINEHMEFILNYNEQTD